MRFRDMIKEQDLIAEAVVAMEFKASAEDISRMSHAHPTFAEAIKEAALAQQITEHYTKRNIEISKTHLVVVSICAMNYLCCFK
jgi:hypothetical protein